MVRLARDRPPAGPGEAEREEWEPYLHDPAASEAIDEPRRDTRTGEEPGGEARECAPSAPSPSSRLALIAGILGASDPAIAACTRKTAAVLWRGVSVD